MKQDKSFLRTRALLQKKQKYKKIENYNFNFELIFRLIKKIFLNKKITIAGYYPANYEVNVVKFLEKASKKNFKLALPVIGPASSMCFNSWIFKDPLYLNSFGILEPKSSNQKVIPDLIIVPLVAFDKQLNRIGYGKGYYDRILNKIKKIKKKTIFIGIAYSFQKCSMIPTNKHDFKLDYIFTERGIISSNY